MAQNTAILTKIITYTLQNSKQKCTAIKLNIQMYQIYIQHYSSGLSEELNNANSCYKTQPQ
jgi:hypothetical protein